MKASQQWECYSHPHFAGEQTEAQRVSGAQSYRVAGPGWEPGFESQGPAEMAAGDPCSPSLLGQERETEVPPRF